MGESNAAPHTTFDPTQYLHTSDPWTFCRVSTYISWKQQLSYSYFEHTDADAKKLPENSCYLNKPHNSTRWQKGSRNANA